MADRIVIVAGPRAGKSTLAQQIMRETGAQHYCADPLSVVKEPLTSAIYLPEGLDYSGDHGAAAYVASCWLTLPGPYVVEGHVMARALRRWLGPRGCDHEFRREFPCDKIVVFENQRHDCDLKRGQVAMHKGVMRVWSEIADYFEPITEYR